MRNFAKSRPLSLTISIVDESLDVIDELLRRTSTVNESAPPATLREWRTNLVHVSVMVSYAIGVLSVDCEYLERCRAAPGDEVLKDLVDHLPQVLASSWVGGGWSLAPDASTSVWAAEQLVTSEPNTLLALHAELATSDLGDPGLVEDLLIRIRDFHDQLADRRSQLEARIRIIQSTILRHYTNGTASTTDWLS